MVRQAKAIVWCSLLMATGSSAASAVARQKIGRWALWEMQFHARVVPANPFTGVTLRGVFTSPRGRQFAVEGFYDGGNVWRLRFMPSEIGTWRWSAQSVPADAGLSGHGVFECVKSRLPGPLRVGKNPLWFASASGMPVYLTCFVLWRVGPHGRNSGKPGLRSRTAPYFPRVACSHTSTRGVSQL